MRTSAGVDIDYRAARVALLSGAEIRGTRRAVPRRGPRLRARSRSRRSRGRALVAGRRSWVAGPIIQRLARLGRHADGGRRRAREDVLRRPLAARRERRTRVRPCRSRARPSSPRDGAPGRPDRRRRRHARPRPNGARATCPSARSCAASRSRWPRLRGAGREGLARASGARLARDAPRSRAHARARGRASGRRAGDALARGRRDLVGADRGPRSARDRADVRRERSRRQAAPRRGAAFDSTPPRGGPRSRSTTPKRAMERRPPKRRSRSPTPAIRSFATRRATSTSRACSGGSPPASRPVTAERAQVRYQVDSLVAGPVVRLSEGGAVASTRTCRTWWSATARGSLQVGGGKLSLRAQPAEGGGVAGRGSMKLVGARLASAGGSSRRGRPRRRFRRPARAPTGWSPAASESASRASSVGALRPSSPATVTSSSASRRCTPTPTSLWPREEISRLSIELASLDVRSPEARAIVDGLTLRAHTALEGHAPYAVELEAPVSRLRVIGRDGNAARGRSGAHRSPGPRRPARRRRIRRRVAASSTPPSTWARCRPRSTRRRGPTRSTSRSAPRHEA